MHLHFKIYAKKNIFRNIPTKTSKIKLKNPIQLFDMEKVKINTSKKKKTRTKSRHEEQTENTKQLYFSQNKEFKFNPIKFKF